MAILSRHFRLAGRKEREVLRLFDEHMEMVLKTVRGLKQVIHSAQHDDWTLVETQAEIVARYETLADDVHREAVLQISQGAFFAGMREDFLGLFEKLDEIADAAQNAARILAQSKLEPKAISHLYEEGNGNLDKFVDEIIRSVDVLAESVRSLESDVGKAVSKSLEVEKIEEAVDELKMKLLKAIYRHKSDIEVLTLLQLKDFVLMLDKIADAAEDSSDLIITTIAKAGS